MTIKVRDYEVRLTRTKEERRMVRQLRYKCFVEEEGAHPTDEQRALGEEYDEYDTYADYMAVLHDGHVVGTYRIITRESADKIGGFYTETEFDLRKIKKTRGEIAEMSRACVDAEYRTNGLVMRMLWMGLAEYVLKNKVTILFGVPSFVGTNPADSAQAISYIYYNHLTPQSLRATVLPEKFAPGINPKLSKMNILPRVFVDKEKAYAQMPPFIKGYLRLGATFGKGVFIDRPFNTYDLFVCLQTKNASRAYQKHFAGSENAFAHLGVQPNAAQKFAQILRSPVQGLAILAKFFLKDDADDAKRIED